MDLSSQTVFMIEDHHWLTGEWIEAGRPVAAAVIHPAIGVLASYYRAFATWLAREHNVTVLIYDYRDMGLSAGVPIRDSKATMADWGVQDQSAALDHVAHRFPNLPIWTIGHWLGGLCLAFQRQANRVTRHIAIASGPSHWTTHPWWYMPIAAFFWFVAGPITTALLGYLPDKILGVGASLPAGVFWQWRRWCITRGFHRCDWGTAMPNPDPASVTAEINLIGISDDALIPPARVKRLARFYPSAAIHYKTLKPEAAGLKKIGHIGFFARRNQAAWPLALA